MTTAQVRGRRRTRWHGFVALTSVVLLAACGAGSPAGGGPDPSRPARAEATPVAAGVTDGVRAAATRSAGWVGTFHGHEVTVPRGNGAHVSFTFDDGPSPRFTPQVLALLDQHDVPAIFCVIGQQARAYPELLRKEVAAGHVLCDHSRDHDLTMNRRGQAYVTDEVTDGLAAIQAASPGVRVPFYRQPGGTWSPQVVRAMDASGLTPLRWTDDPRDWSRPGANAVVRRVTGQLKPDGVILMHDGGGNRSQTIEALRWLLDALPAAGWVPVLAPEAKLSKKDAARPQ